jgi:hypothetical protein
MRHGYSICLCPWFASRLPGTYCAWVTTGSCAGFSLAVLSGAGTQLRRAAASANSSSNRGGYGAARNEGIKASHGEVVSTIIPTFIPPSLTLSP